MEPKALEKTPFVPVFRSVDLILRARQALCLVLDIVIGIDALGLLLIVAIGGADLVLISFTRAEKPILILALAIPLRLTIGEPFALLKNVQLLLSRPITILRTAIRDRVPAAVTDVAFAIAATRSVNFSVGFIANLVFTPNRPRAFPMPFEAQKFAELFADWDSGWYFDIASRGYYFNPNGQSSIAFFPLYPMLMRAVAWPFGGSDKAIWMAGIAISWVAFTLAMVALHRLTERVFNDRESARRTVLYLAVFPFSIFFTRVYAESLFLLTSVLAVSSAQQGRWWRAGVWGALAALARPNGMVIAVPLALMAFRAYPSLRDVTRRFVALSLIPVAVSCYCAYVYSLSGDPIGWLSAQTHWGYSLGHPPWQQMLAMIGRVAKYGLYDYFFSSSRSSFYLLHGIAALIFLMLTPATFKRLGIAFGAYVLVSLLVPLSSNALEGLGRYAAVLFPAFMLLGSLKLGRLHEGLLIISSIWHALIVCLFSTGQPIY
jgi:hypothetical protein